MWYLVTYPIDKGLFSHVVEESCLEEHNLYIKEKYDAEPNWVKEIDMIRIDPGGIMLKDGGSQSFSIGGSDVATINDEHILTSIDYYFSLDLLGDALERMMNPEEDSKGYTVRVLKEDIVKVYQPYSILVMRADMYMFIAESIEKFYMAGLQAYYNLAPYLPDEYFIETMILDAMLYGDIAEA